MGSRRPNGLCTASAAQSPNLETTSRLLLAGALNRALYDIAVRVACFDRAPNGVVLEMQRLMSGDCLSRPRDALERSGLGDDAVAAHRGHASRDRATSPRLRTWRSSRSAAQRARRASALAAQSVAAQQRWRRIPSDKR